MWFLVTTSDVFYDKNKQKHALLFIARGYCKVIFKRFIVTIKKYFNTGLYITCYALKRILKILFVFTFFTAKVHIRPSQYSSLNELQLV